MQNDENDAFCGGLHILGGNVLQAKAKVNANDEFMLAERVEGTQKLRSRTLSQRGIMISV